MRLKSEGVIDREVIAGQKVKEREFWLSRLSGELPRSNFPYDFHGIEETAIRGGPDGVRGVLNGNAGRGELSTVLERSTIPGLLKICGGSDIRLHILLTAAAAVLLYKYTGETDILTGSPIYKQKKAAGEEFINTILVFRHRFDPGAVTFNRLLVETGKTVYESVEHQNFPLETLIPRLSLPFGRGQALTNVAVVLENIHDQRYTELLDAALSVSFLRTNADIYMTMRYCRGRYRRNTIRKIAGHFHRLLEMVPFQGDVPVMELDILLPEEKEKLLVEWNDTRQLYPLEQTVCDLFTYRSWCMGDGTVLACKGSDVDLPGLRITYRELERRVHVLTRELRRRGVGTDMIVGVMTDRTPDLLVGILAVLFAGGTYLPISPEYPVARQRFMMEDSGARMLLTYSGMTGPTGPLNDDLFSGEVCFIDDPEPAGEGIPDNISFALPDGAAYVIYTSGTTGTPKGVMIEHRSLTNLLFSMYWSFSGNIGPDDRCLSITSISFDVSICELFLPLIFGACLVLLPEENRFRLPALARTIIKEAITFAYIPPALLGGLYDYLDALLNNRSGCLSLGKLLVGAEPIMDTVLDKYSRLNPLIHIINGYGPTETTIFSTTFQYQPGTGKGERIPIGKPVGNSQVYILDPETNTQLSPPGVIGELFIAGTGVARGYLNRPELTAGYFLNTDGSRNHFEQNTIYDMKFFVGRGLVNPSPGDRRQFYYKTGDLVYFGRDGVLSFIGRKDRQIKVRGHRIEQGEIETRLVMHDSVREAVVLDGVDESGETFLCAYVVPQDVSSYPGGTELREYLRRFLPLYMVPAYFVEVDGIPVTINGKVDREALPAPRASSREYAAPRSDTEKKMAVIWQEILKVDRAGIDDNFFDMGGTSMSIVRLNSRVKETFGREIADTKILEYPTIKAFSHFIDGGGGEGDVTAPREDGRGIDRKKLMTRNRRMRGDKEWARTI